MGRGIIYFVFQRPRFCCCLPVRICVIIMSLLGILLSGILSVVLWFEVSRADALTKMQRTSFAGGAVVQTFFFLISILGLIGGIARKLTLASAYAIGLYVHFLINLGIAGYLFYVILHSTHADTVALCQNALTNSQAKGQCDSLFDSIRGVYAGLASFVLVVELYGAIVATRYAYQLQGEKREARLPKYARVSLATGDSSRLIPGFMRYRDSSGATVYDSYYHPETAKGHARGASAHSLSGSEGETELYDPPKAGLHESALDDYKGHGHKDPKYEDHDRDSVLDPPPGLERPKETRETVGAVRGDELR